MADQKTMLTEDELLARAGDAARRMRSTVAGQPLDTVTQSTAATLLGVADLLSGLSTGVQIRRRETGVLRMALQRIADMEIPNAIGLLGNGDWKEIAAELQVIAHEALTGQTLTARRT